MTKKIRMWKPTKEELDKYNVKGILKEHEEKYKSEIGKKLGETLVALKLIEEKCFIPCPSFIDIDGIDLVVKYNSFVNCFNNNNPLGRGRLVGYCDPQIKYSKNYDNKFIFKFKLNKKTLRQAPNFFYVFCCEKKEDIFVIPSDQFLGTLDLGKYKNEFNLKIIKNKKNKWILKTNKGEIKLNNFYNNFKSMKCVYTVKSFTNHQKSKKSKNENYLKQSILIFNHDSRNSANCG